MSVFTVAGGKANQAFWQLLKALGLVLNVAGGLALLGSIIVITEQCLGFMRDDHWQSKSLLSALPDAIVNWVISIGNLAGISFQLVNFLYWIPLSLAAFVAGLCLIAIAKVMRRDYETF
jgi:hypothetical protein